MFSDMLGKQGLRATPQLEAVTARLGKTCATTDVSGRNASGNVRNQGVQANSCNDDHYALIDTAQAARILRCTPANVRDLARRQVLPGRRAGGRWVYPAEAVLRRAAER